MSNSVVNFYDELGVSSQATQEEVKKAYQQHVLKVHPDKADKKLSASEKEANLHHYHMINKAWKILGDEEKRKQYDKGLREETLLQEWPVNAEVDLDDMEQNEETCSFTWKCRCSGQYVITEQDLEKGQNIVCCSICTLCIKVLYAIVSDNEDDEQDHKP
ncbi:DPH4 homolog [Exaiptasia diaphana]|uniref:Diphthamide biosynthesis protein 4 n=1 Tax=Exaiptasia diaphana TaxID=2652724 RepID=A0A913XLU6_EXADI|nr:DPH4 homolog [Exaiptasia diaphana]KXJ11036.1 DPH4-like [Exaiptasia diaphana]